MSGWILVTLLLANSAIWALVGVRYRDSLPGLVAAGLISASSLYLAILAITWIEHPIDSDFGVTRPEAVLMIFGAPILIAIALGLLFFFKRRP